MSTYSTTANLCDDLRHVLEDIASAVGKESQLLASNETLARCSFTVSLQPQMMLEMFTHERVKPWFDVFGSALNIEVSVDEFDFGPKMIAVESLGFIDNVRTFVIGHDVQSAELTISIQKSLLMPRVGETLGGDVSALFFYASALLKRLTLKGIDALHKDGALSTAKRSVVAVLNASGLLQGPLVTVVGLRDATPEDIQHDGTPDAALKNWLSALKLRQSVSTWSGPLSLLPPESVLVGSLRPGLDDVYTALTAICKTLSILQFCESVVTEDGFYIARVYRRDGPEFRISSDEVVAEADGSTSGSLAPLFGLYTWALPSETRTRLDVVRQVIREAAQRTPDISIDRLDKLGQQLLDAAEASYAILCHDAFTAYLQVRKEAEATISANVELTRRNISTLGEELLNTVLQFVAGAFAFIVANALRQDISPALREAGFSLGTIYIVLIVIFRLVRTYYQYYQQKSDSVATIERYVELPRNLRDSFTSILSRDFLEFNIWFTLCAIAYITGLAVLIMLWTGSNVR